jgi:hypothetical protein
VVPSQPVGACLISWATMADYSIWMVLEIIKFLKTKTAQCAFLLIKLEWTVENHNSQ